MILIEKWDSFCVETKRLGTEKMSHAKSEAEKIIQSGHSHSHKVKFLQKLPIFGSSKPSWLKNPCEFATKFAISWLIVDLLKIRSKQNEMLIELLKFFS